MWWFPCYQYFMLYPQTRTLYEKFIRNKWTIFGSIVMNYKLFISISYTEDILMTKFNFEWDSLMIFDNSLDFWSFNNKLFNRIISNTDYCGTDELFSEEQYSILKLNSTISYKQDYFNFQWIMCAMIDNSKFWKLYQTIWIIIWHW